ncbi:AIR synthase related protein, partial [Microbacterium sp.]|uniref:AIR synthase related protein n=1 Tax=Microbacterium sp. TaxID=51671 RepID=UPI003A898C2F
MRDPAPREAVREELRVIEAPGEEVTDDVAILAGVLQGVGLLQLLLDRSADECEAFVAGLDEASGAAAYRGQAAGRDLHVGNPPDGLPRDLRAVPSRGATGRWDDARRRPGAARLDWAASPGTRNILEHRRVSTPVADTVENAVATPEKDQPYGALGLKDDEYAEIRSILGRRPTSGELAMYSVMWSEHCSYKSSKIYLRRFGQKVSDEMRERLMVGMGQNAGVVDIGEGWAVTFKVESHNHPSYIEPFQGAATGVGGIVRDIISMGARPVAVMDQLRFGAIDHPDTARVVHGVVSGISF